MTTLDERANQMMSGPVLMLLLRMATPQAMGFLVQSSVSIAEIWFIGKLGTASLAAMALVFPLLMLMQMLSGGAIGGAVTGSTARKLGAGDIEPGTPALDHYVDAVRVDLVDTTKPLD